MDRRGPRGHRSAAASSSGPAWVARPDQSPNRRSAASTTSAGVDVAARPRARPATGRRPAHGPRAARSGVSASTVVAGAGRRAMVRARGRVDRRDVGLVGAAARVGPGLEQVGEALVAQPVDLGLGERRAADDLGEQLERGLEAARRDVDARRTSASQPGLGVERGAEALGGLGQRDGVAALRALGQGAGGQDRGAALRVRARPRRPRGRRARPTRAPARASA